MKPAKKKTVSASEIPFMLPDVTLPFSKGWMREVVKRSLVKKGKKNYDVYYFTPEGYKLRSMKEIGKYLEKNKIDELKEENFSFTEKLIFKEPFEKQRNANDGSFRETVHKKKEGIKKVQNDKSLVKANDFSKKKAPAKEKILKVKLMPTKPVNKGINKTKVKVDDGSKSAKVSKKSTRKMPPRSSKTNIKSPALKNVLNLNNNNFKDIKEDLVKLRIHVNGGAAASKSTTQKT